MQIVIQSEPSTDTALLAWDVVIAHAKALRPMDPVWDDLDGRRARFVRMVDDLTVEIADNDGRVLPDYRHVTQVSAL